MATGYTRNDTANNISNGNLINASDLDGEFDAIQTAMNAIDGHTHDGTTGGGAPVVTLGPVQDVVITTTVMRPKVDNTVDLGTSTLEFKNLYLDGTAQVDTLQVDESATIAADLTVSGNATIVGNTVVNGNTTLGNSATDTVIITADVASDLIPSIDNTYDLGAATDEWRNLYIDGTAQVDTLQVDESATITADLTVNGNTTLGNAATDTVTITADVASHLTPSIDNTYDLGAATDEWRNLYIDGVAQVDTLQVDESATITADLTVNGNTTLGNSATDTVTITADVASSLIPSVDNTHDLGTATDEWRNIYVDGIAQVDTLQVDESATITADLTVNGNTTLGNAATDTVTITADVASSLIPSADNLYDLGAVGSEWKDLYITGTANIDSLVADTATISAGTITGITDLAVADGGTGASTASGARTNLGLGTISTQDSNNVSISGGSITGITDLAVADGGTGSSTASGARTNLGLGTISTQDSSNVSITGGSVTGITDLAIADGGTGASTAADARTNLGLGTAATTDSTAYVPRTSATGSAGIPTGTEAQRDGTPSTGFFRFNTTVNKFEGYNGAAWGSVGGGATGGGNDEVFVENAQSVTTNYTLTTNKNAMSTGPITVNSGVTVTIPTGSNWVVL